jgi:hypothetical protein
MNYIQIGENVEPKYPNIVVELVGRDGNAFAILSATLKAMKENGVSVEERKLFIEETKSGDYDHLLQTVMKWVTAE